jgi:hypothetical protein
MPGVGRIEDEASNAHWRTDLRFYNPSTLPRTVFLEFHYTPTGRAGGDDRHQAAHDRGEDGHLDRRRRRQLPRRRRRTPTSRRARCSALLKVTYNAPPDVATAPLIIGGRIYRRSVDGHGRHAALRLHRLVERRRRAPPRSSCRARRRTCASGPTSASFALGTLPTTVRIHAIKQDGTETSTYDFTLNDRGHGAFAQIPMTALPTIDGTR